MGKVYFVANVGAEYKPSEGGGLPMLGLYTGAVVSGVTIENIAIKRLVAKVVLRYKNSLYGFTITSIRLCNIPSAISFGVEKNEGSIFPTFAEDSHIDYPAEEMAALSEDIDGYRELTWNVPENLRGVNIDVGSLPRLQRLTPWLTLL